MDPGPKCGLLLILATKLKLSVKCDVCPGVIANRIGKLFSITEGWSAITSHASGSKHKQYLAEYLEAETDNIR